MTLSQVAVLLLYEDPIAIVQQNLFTHKNSPLMTSKLKIYTVNLLHSCLKFWILYWGEFRWLGPRETMRVFHVISGDTCKFEVFVRDLNFEINVCIFPSKQHSMQALLSRAHRTADNFNTWTKQSRNAIGRIASDRLNIDITLELV